MLTVLASKGWLYANWMMVFVGTLVAPLNGFVAKSTGAVVG